MKVFRERGESISGNVNSARRNFHSTSTEDGEAARAAFDQLPKGTKLPTVKELNAERTRLIQERQAEYAKYRKVKAERTEFIRAKQNADVILYRRQEEHDDRIREK